MDKEIYKKAEAIRAKIETKNRILRIIESPFSITVDSPQGSVTFESLRRGGGKEKSEILIRFKELVKETKKREIAELEKEFKEL